MKYLSLLFVFFIILNSCSNMEKQTKELISKPITGQWMFKKIDYTGWMEATVPGTVHTDLLSMGIIEDPYYRTNEKGLQWIDKEDWEYRVEFMVDETLLEKEEIELVFEGLDTYAEVYLNNEKVLEADNMFREWEVSCKEYLKSGLNELRVVLKSPTNIGLEKLEVNGYPLPASNDQSEYGEMGENKVSIFTRKTGYHYGWDWGPRLVTSGIWRPVKLIAYNTAKITNVHYIQNTVGDEFAQFSAIFEVDAINDFKGRINLEFNGNSKTNEIDFRAGLNQYEISFDIENPKRWWPNGLGEAFLYSVDLNLENGEGKLLDQNNAKVGVRTIELVRKKDKKGDGESFYFEVNGHPVFAKGANYIPNDVFLTRFSEEDYERIVKDAADANMNMLRVWGGGIYENDIFYDLCDKYGIMVWQDFMYACSMYPGDDDFLNNARVEAEENIRRLRNHPSLALWCGNNEIEVAWGEYEENRGWGWKQRYTPEQRKEIWQNYDTLFHHILPDAVSKLNPQINYWHSSPSAGMGKLAGDTNITGDMHYWGVWHGQHPFEDFRKYRSRFMSEYGFQSFPELNTVSKYALPEEWDIESEVMAAHQRSGIGNLRIRQYMEDDYVIPEDFNHFLYVSQLLQAEGIKMAIESHRADMPYCMGSLYWQLNDCWPVASWSGIDYYGRWKALHYFVKKAFEEVHAGSFLEEQTIQHWIVSDKLEDTEANLRLMLIDFTGNILWQNEEILNIPANAMTVTGYSSLYLFEEYGSLNEMAMISVLYDDQYLISKNIQYLVKPKDLKLKNPELSVEVDVSENKYIITLKASTLAKNVFLSTDLTSDHFSDNYFDVFPGQPVQISFPKTSNIEDFRSTLKVISLFDTLPYVDDI